MTFTSVAHAESSADNGQGVGYTYAAGSIATNQTPSNLEKHEKAQARKKRDQERKEERRKKGKGGPGANTSMSKSIRGQLADALARGCLVQIHRNPKDWGRFQVGYVDSIDGDSLRIRSVSPRGEVLGFEVYALEAVTGVVLNDDDNDYLDKLSRLVRGGRDVYRKVSPWKQAGIRGALEEAMRRQRIVTLGRAHDELQSPRGLVRAMTDDAVSIQLVDQYGEDDGIATIPIEGINTVHFGTEDEQILDYLRSSYAADEAAS